MAQTLTAPFPAAGGNTNKLKAAILQLTNNGGETTYTLTAALAGVGRIWFAVAIDQTTGVLVAGIPTVEASSTKWTQVAFTFTANRSLSIFVIGE